MVIRLISAAGQTDPFNAYDVSSNFTCTDQKCTIVPGDIAAKVLKDREPTNFTVRVEWQYVFCCHP